MIPSAVAYLTDNMLNQPDSKIIEMSDHLLVPYKYDTGHFRFDRNPDYRNQVFSYKMRDYPEIYHFDIAKLIRIIAANPNTPIANFKITPNQVSHVVHHNGIEREHLDRLTGKQLVTPGIICIWPDNTQTVLDGNHRYVKRARNGLTVMRFYVLTIDQCRPVLLDLPEAFSRSMFQE